MKCNDCKYLDLTQKTSEGYVCINTKRKWMKNKKRERLKYPTTNACKYGFEPKEKEVAGNE